MESTLNFKIKSLNHQVDQLFSFIEQGIREPLIKCRELLIKFQNNFDGFFYQIKNYFDNLNSFDRLLNNLDPKRLLQRGYGIVHGPKGIVKSIKEVALGDNLMIELGKGNLGAKVTKLNN